MTWHRIASHHITSHHITSHHITSHHITSHHITSLQCCDACSCIMQTENMHIIKTMFFCWASPPGLSQCRHHLDVSLSSTPCTCVEGSQANCTTSKHVPSKVYIPCACNPNNHYTSARAPIAVWLWLQGKELLSPGKNAMYNEEHKIVTPMNVGAPSTPYPHTQNLLLLLC